MAVRDGLKPLDKLLEPDSRNKSFARFDPSIGDFAPITLEQHYADIEHYTLDEIVPEGIATQFDVARNLYLYAWFEYRFYNVAEAKVLTVLEFAMKKRTGEDEIKRYIKQRNSDHKQKTGMRGGVRNGMKTLMEYCRDHHLIRNDGFTEWHNYATQRTYQKEVAEQHQWAIAEMERTGDNEIELPDIQIESLPPDPSYDHVQHLIDNTNKVRNLYAHGSKMLHRGVLGRFEMVSEFINQLYAVDRPIT